MFAASSCCQKLFVQFIGSRNNKNLFSNILVMEIGEILIKPKGFEKAEQHSLNIRVSLQVSKVLINRPNSFSFICRTLLAVTATGTQ